MLQTVLTLVVIHSSLWKPSIPQRIGIVYLAEEVELLVQWGADLHQSGRARLRLVGADCSDPDVAQISNIQGAIGADSQRGRSFETSVTGIASIT